MNVWSGHQLEYRSLKDVNKPEAKPRAFNGLKASISMLVTAPNIHYRYSLIKLLIDPCCTFKVNKWLKKKRTISARGEVFPPFSEFALWRVQIRRSFVNLQRRRFLNIFAKYTNYRNFNKEKILKSGEMLKNTKPLIKYRYFNFVNLAFPV